MTIETLNALLGAFLSLLLSFTSIRNWYEPLSSDAKRLIVAGVLALISLTSYLLACFDVGAAFEMGIECGPGGALAILEAFLAAAVANQATYALTPRKPAEDNDDLPFA
jgi:hypothetical protein